MPLAVDIAVTHLLTRKRQTAVSMLGVAMGVGFAIAMAGLMDGFQTYFISKVIDVTPHIVMKDEFRNPPVQPAALRYSHGALNLRGVRPRDEIRGIRRAQSIVASLSRRANLSVAPSLEGQVFLRYGSKDVGATLIGIEPDRQRTVSNLERDLTAGSLDALKTSANGLIIGVDLARKLGVKMRDTVTAVSPAGVILKMKIVGIFRTGLINLDGSTSYALLKKVQVLQKRINVINQINMRLKDADAAQRVAASIERRFLYRTESWQEANEGVLGVFVIQHAIMYATTGAILVVACFGIFNVISTIIFEKTRDIAILKSMGFEEGDIRMIFLIEGVAVGVLGSLLGWGLGYALLQLLASVKFDVEGIVKLQGFVLHSTWVHYAIGTVAAMSSAAFAAYLPARKAARLRPVDIIRGAA
jgi:lipoprotein-releasing system permease protein